MDETDAAAAMDILCGAGAVCRRDERQGRKLDSEKNAVKVKHLLYLSFVSAALLLLPTFVTAKESSDISKPAAELSKCVTVILDANNQIWDKINTVEVNIAIDNLIDTVNKLDRDKNDLARQIRHEEIRNKDVLWTKIITLRSAVSGLRKPLDDFAHEINKAAGSAVIGDGFTNAAKDLAINKAEALSQVPDIWQHTSHAAAEARLQAAIADNREILRALGCLQDTINQGSKPARDCDFPQLSQH